MPFVVTPSCRSANLIADIGARLSPPARSILRETFSISGRTKRVLWFHRPPTWFPYHMQLCCGNSSENKYARSASLHGNIARCALSRTRDTPTKTFSIVIAPKRTPGVLCRTITTLSRVIPCALLYVNANAALNRCRSTDGAPFLDPDLEKRPSNTRMNSLEIIIHRLRTRP